MTGSQRRPSRRRALSALVLALSLVGVACSSGTNSASSDGGRSSVPGGTAAPGTTARSVANPNHATGASAGCKATPAKPGTTNETMTSGDKERKYQLEVPEGYDGTKPLPLVLGLHSLTVDYRMVPGISGFADMAKKYDFIAVSPSGLVSTVPYWNAAPVADNYDVKFIGELLDHLEKTLCIDTSKVFSVGMSNGAQLSSTLACQMPDRITAIAPIAGVEYNPPCDGAPVPVIAFHGVEDPIVPYTGGGLNSVRIADQNFYKGSVPAGTAEPTGVDESMKNWAKHNGCDPEYDETRLSPEVRKRVWKNCKAATEIYLVDNGGHAWPGKPQPAFEKSFGHGTKDIDATSLIWAFFLDQQS